MHEQGYNWMFGASTSCNMSVAVVPSLRMDWNKTTNDPDAESKAWWNPSNYPDRKYYHPIAGMDCSEKFVDETSAKSASVGSLFFYAYYNDLAIGFAIRSARQGELNPPTNCPPVSGLFA